MHVMQQTQAALFVKHPKVRSSLWSTAAVAFRVNQLIPHTYADPGTRQAGCCKAARRKCRSTAQWTRLPQVASYWTLEGGGSRSSCDSSYVYITTSIPAMWVKA